MVLRIIQVGLGALGLTGYPVPGRMEGWNQVVNRSRDWVPVAYVDVLEERLRIANEQFGIPREKLFRSTEEAVEKVEADAVLIVTPTKYHMSPALTATKAGLHVLMEKPFADTMENAKKMVEEAERQGVKLMVDQNHRFNTWVRTLRKLVKERAAGDLGYVIVTKGWAGYREESWRYREKHTMLVNTGIHTVDQIRCMTGLDPINASARTWRPKWSWFPGNPAVTIVYEMEDDVMVSYHESNVSLGKGYSTWSFECSEGEIRIEGGKIMAYLNEPTFGVSATSALEVRPVSMTLQERDYVLHEFAEAITQDREAETSGKDNLKSLAMVHAAIKSIETGRLVEIREVL